MNWAAVVAAAHLLPPVFFMSTNLESNILSYSAASGIPPKLDRLRQVLFAAKHATDCAGQVGEAPIDRRLVEPRARPSKNQTMSQPYYKAHQQCGENDIREEIAAIGHPQRANTHRE
jgi:hypothetical protein